MKFNIPQRAVVVFLCFTALIRTLSTVITIIKNNFRLCESQELFFFLFWKGTTFSDAGSDGTQPASCVDILSRQSTYSCRCPMYGACQNDVFCGLFYSATLAIRCRSKAPFVHERLKTPNTSPQAVEPDP